MDRYRRKEEEDEEEGKEGEEGRRGNGEDEQAMYASGGHGWVMGEMEDGSRLGERKGVCGV